MTTPLACSIKTHQPEARVDYLVFAGTEGILAKNPYVDRVMTMPRGSRDTAFVASLWHRYDVALATNPSDRMTLFGVVAGKRSYGLLQGLPAEWWKRLFLTGWRRYDDRNHVVPGILSLLDGPGIPKQPRVVMGFDADDETFVRTRLAGGAYVVLHPYSRSGCKFWGAEKWGALAGLIHDRLGLRTVFTVTPDPADRAFLERIAAAAPTGIEWFPEPFSLNQLAAAIAGSAAYVGIDTAATHIAAAVGAPTVAIFGPTLTRYWAPWPNGCRESSPFGDGGGVQRVGNVTVVQKPWECVPCNRESCAISRRDRMECLEEITPEEVFREVMDHVGHH
ncbi:MAG TPA: glycosyltransferase family 9 protein [Desulfuromonadaceae bacterium]